MTLCFDVESSFRYNYVYVLCVYVYIVQFVFCVTGLKPLLVALRPIQRYGTGSA